ncbi:hypothetical protein BN2497_13397 [Janthinobacterium sp. CG23_2]|nr:hypothetical protein BN2497_13397 [Janthinobacterium sp. CG23_2]CUU33096.1 hypothetical protein BN3177_13397 [Janthinobacterium sp. CG23_2]
MRLRTVNPCQLWEHVQSELIFANIRSRQAFQARPGQN